MKQEKTKAELVCEKIRGFFTEEKYLLMGMEKKTLTYPRGMSFMKKQIEKAKIDVTGEISADKLSPKQHVLFSNLTTIDHEKFPDLIEANMIDDVKDPNAKNVILISYSKNKLGQDVVTKTNIIFRYYTEEEKAEYLRKQEQKNAEAMGFITGTETSNVMQDLLAGF